MEGERAFRYSGRQWCIHRDFLSLFGGRRLPADEDENQNQDEGDDAGDRRLALPARIPVKE